MRVIPAIDLLDGQVVRLHKGSYEEVSVYNTNPVEEAKKFQEAGFKHLHIIDLNGAKEGKFVNLEYITRIIEELDISVQTGGGVRSYDDVLMLIEHGITNVICSSMAVKQAEEWLKVLDDFADHAILGMDLKNGKVAYSGWQETHDQSIDNFLDPMIKQGLKTILSTDISRDGTLEGPNFELYKNLSFRFPEVNFIASGGVGGVEDLAELSDMNVYGVVVGRAYYEHNLTLDQMQQYHTS